MEVMAMWVCTFVGGEELSSLSSVIWLLKWHSYTIKLAGFRAMTLYKCLGLQLKSSLPSVQRIVFIGAILDAITARAYLPDDRFLVLSHLIMWLQIRSCLQLLGHRVACTFVMFHAQLHLHYIQAWFRWIYTPYRDSCFLSPLVFYFPLNGGRIQTQSEGPIQPPPPTHMIVSTPQMGSSSSGPYCFLCLKG